MRCFDEIANKIAPAKSKALRLLALAVCVLFTAAFLFSVSFILTRANHVHDHNGANGCCATCVQVTAAAKLLNQLSAAIVKAAAMIFSLFAGLSLLRFFAHLIEGSSLVALKVQLNN